MIFEIEGELTRAYFDEMHCSSREEILSKMRTMMDMAQFRMSDIYPKQQTMGSESPKFKFVSRLKKGKQHVKKSQYTLIETNFHRFDKQISLDFIKQTLFNANKSCTENVEQHSQQQLIL